MTPPFLVYSRPRQSDFPPKKLPLHLEVIAWLHCTTARSAAQQGSGPSTIFLITSMQGELLLQAVPSSTCSPWKYRERHWNDSYARLPVCYSWIGFRGLRCGQSTGAPQASSLECRDTACFRPLGASPSFTLTSVGRQYGITCCEAESDSS